MMMPTSLLILIPLLRPYSALATQYTMRQVHGTSGAWCMVNCTLFDFVQSSLRENKFDNTMSDVLIAICCSVWRKVKDVARHCAVLCIFALLHKRVDTNVQWKKNCNVTSTSSRFWEQVGRTASSITAQGRQLPTEIVHAIVTNPCIILEKYMYHLGEIHV